MKLIITEQQFKRLTRSSDTCPNMVRFKFYDKKWGTWGKRNVCVDDNFYNLLTDYLELDLENRTLENVNPELIEMIRTYFDETYYRPVEHLQIDNITNFDIPTISVKYKLRP